MNDLISKSRLLEWYNTVYRADTFPTPVGLEQFIETGYLSPDPEPIPDAPRPVVTQRIIALLDQQNAKGRTKYGTTIDDAPDEAYDWPIMAMEEAIDLMQYQQKEIMRQQREIFRLAMFARFVLGNSFAGDHTDGGEAQDFAHSLELIVQTAYNPEVHGYHEGFNPGDPFFVFADILKERGTGNDA